MSGMTRFIIRAVCALGGFMIGTLVVGIIVGMLGMYGTFAAVLTVVAGLVVAYGGYRVGLVVVDRRERGSYADPGEQPYGAYDQGTYPRHR